MIGTALLIAGALFIVGLCILALMSSRRRRLDRARIPPEVAARARAEALQQLSRENKGHAGGEGFSPTYPSGS
jgi:hypothetical protein